jgi:hypothetical protein
MRMMAGSAVLAVLGLVGVLAGVAGAAHSMSPAGGVIEVYVTPPPSFNGAVFKIVVIGAIGDYGTATSIDKDGKVDSNGNYVKIRLKKGTFEVNSVALNKKTNSAPPTLVNRTTCSYGFGASGPVTLFNGTGLYAGISGTLRITQTFAAVGPPHMSGPKKGQCNMSNNAQPLAIYGSILGKGTVKFA